MINKRLIIDKAIEQANYDYQDAINNKQTIKAKRHQKRIYKLIQLRKELETKCELEDLFAGLPNKHHKHHNAINKELIICLI